MSRCQSAKRCLRAYIPYKRWKEKSRVNVELEVGQAKYLLSRARQFKAFDGREKVDCMDKADRRMKPPN
jgi:hypothetical protein